MQLIVDRDANIAQLHLADRKGEEREFALLELLKFRAEKAAGEGPECAFAGAVETRKPRGKLLVDFQTAAQSELGVEKEFPRPEGELRIKRALTAGRYLQP